MTDILDEIEMLDRAPCEASDGGENPVAAAIDAAEEIPDPLDGLIDRVADDPGAPFVPDVLEQIASLKKADRAAFEAFRARLKKPDAASPPSTRPSWRRMAIADAVRPRPTS